MYLDLNRWMVLKKASVKYSKISVIYTVQTVQFSWRIPWSCMRLSNRYILSWKNADVKCMTSSERRQMLSIPKVSTTYGVQQLYSHERRQVLSMQSVTAEWSIKKENVKYFKKYQPHMELRLVAWKKASPMYLEIKGLEGKPMLNVSRSINPIMEFNS